MDDGPERVIETLDGELIEAAVEELPGGGVRLRFDLPSGHVLETFDRPNEIAVFVDDRLQMRSRLLTEEELAELDDEPEDDQP
jgi:hypothetical protein